MNPRKVKERRKSNASEAEPVSLKSNTLPQTRAEKSKRKKRVSEQPVREAKPFILVITGITTSGKSTLLKGLRRRKSLQDGVVFHDMDENGTPDAGRSHWRKFRVEQLLHDAMSSYSEGKSTVLCGVIYPHEVIDSEHFDSAVNLHYLFLTNSKKVFADRVRKKSSNNPKYKYLKTHIPHFLRARDHLKHQIASQLRHYIVDGGRSDSKAVVEKTLAFIEEIRK